MNDTSRGKVIAIATAHGWTVAPPSKDYYMQPTAVFHKGDLRVSFSRRGHRWIRVLWRDHRVPPGANAPWEQYRFLDGTAEEITARLLPLVTETIVKKYIEKSMRIRVTQSMKDLADAEKKLAKFLKESR